MKLLAEIFFDAFPTETSDLINQFSKGRRIHGNTLLEANKYHALLKCFNALLMSCNAPYNALCDLINNCNCGYNTL